MLITRPFAYNESLQHPTVAVLLIKILIVFRPLSRVHLFQSNQCLQAIEFVDRCVSEKLKIFLSFLRKTCVASNTQGPQGKERKERKDSLLCPKYDERRVADYESRYLRKRH